MHKNIRLTIFFYWYFYFCILFLPLFFFSLLVRVLKVCICCGGDAESMGCHVSVATLKTWLTHLPSWRRTRNRETEFILEDANLFSFLTSNVEMKRTKEEENQERKKKNDWNIHRTNSWKRARSFFSLSRMKIFTEKKSLFMHWLCFCCTYLRLISDYLESVKDKLKHIIIIIIGSVGAAYFSLSLPSSSLVPDPKWRKKIKGRTATLWKIRINIFGFCLPTDDRVLWTPKKIIYTKII